MGFILSMHVEFRARCCLECNGRIVYCVCVFFYHLVLGLVFV